MNRGRKKINSGIKTKDDFTGMVTFKLKWDRRTGERLSGRNEGNRVGRRECRGQGQAVWAAFLLGCESPGSCSGVGVP